MLNLRRSWDWDFMKDKCKLNWQRRWRIEKLLLRYLSERDYRIARKQIESNGGLGWGFRRKWLTRPIQPIPKTGG
jgi:hypothetical protein